MKVILFVVLSFIVLGYAETEIEQIGIGILKGFGDDIGFDDVSSCISDSEGSYYDIQTAVQDYQDGSTDIKGILCDLGNALIDILNGFKSCKAIASDVEHIISQLKYFTSPISLLYHVGEDLVLNGVSILEDIDSAFQDFEYSEYEEFGEKIGDILGKLLLSR